MAMVWLASRSGEFAGAAAEAGADQRLLVARADHRLAVELLDRQFRQLGGGDGVGQGTHRRLQILALERAEAEEAATAALDEHDRLAVAQQQVGAGGATGATTALELRPGQRGAVGVGRVGGGEDEVRAVAFGQRAQALDRAGEGELGAAEALDEVAAAGGAEQLEVAELP